MQRTISGVVLLRHPLHALTLQLRHVTEQALLFQQISRSSYLCHTPAGKQSNLVRMHDSAHAVGDDEHRLIPNESGQCRLHRCLVFHIRRGGRLIQQNHRRVLQNGAGNGDALPCKAIFSHKKDAAGRNGHFMG